MTIKISSDITLGTVYVETSNAIANLTLAQANTLQCRIAQQLDECKYFQMQFFQ
jgi:hypothetical protein